MKKLLLAMLGVAMIAALCTTGAWAYTINDSPNDSIGYPLYESYGINMYNFTPGTNSGSIILDLFTNYPQAGETVYGNPPWTTRPADLFITETYKGSQYSWAVPLVTHDGFSSGNMYAVGTYAISDDFDPSHGSGYIYNHGVKVSIVTAGNNYGFTDMGSAGAPFQTATWTALSAGHPDYVVRLNLGVWEDDPNGHFSFTWGTATCANDIVSGHVPLPPSVLLLGSGILGLVGLGWRRRQSS